MLKRILSAVSQPATQVRSFDIPVFPLGTVLFPGSIMPLRIFEQRYMDMAKACLKNSAPFGICLIREGAEVGAPAVPEPVGTIARIVDWDMQQLGVLQVRVGGEDRLRLLDSRVLDNGLIIGTAELMPADIQSDCSEFTACRDFLGKVLPQIGRARYSGETQLDDPSWVSFRITELLPISQTIKQKMLELTDARMRLEILHRVLKEQRLIA